MKIRESVFALIMMAITVSLAPSCEGGRTNDNDTVASDSGIQDTLAKSETDNDCDSLEAAVAEEEESVKEPAPKQTATKRSSTAAEYNGGKETMYISTYGANGKVWGHVTLNGKTGRGTIHDEDENSYSITVTRHGGELFGTDQNGRQYVFRL